MDKKLFGERIKELRLEKGIRQQELAEILNIPFGTVARWEQGVSCPKNYDDLLCIADFFGCSLDYLTGRVEEQAIGAHDLRRLTGLSEKAVSKLLENHHLEANSIFYSFPLSEILERDLFWEALFTISMLIRELCKSNACISNEISEHLFERYKDDYKNLLSDMLIDTCKYKINHNFALTVDDIIEMALEKAGD